MLDELITGFCRSPRNDLPCHHLCMCVFLRCCFLFVVFCCCFFLGGLTLVNTLTKQSSDIHVNVHLSLASVSSLCSMMCYFHFISGVRSDVYQWWCVPCLGGNICCCLQCFRAHHVGHFGWQVLIQGRTAVAVDSEMCGGFGCLARFSSTGVLQGFTRFGETRYWLVSWL